METISDYKKMASIALAKRFPKEKFVLDRFPDGVINHAFACLSPKRQLVLRISHHYYSSDFEKERWAFSQANKQGVPVPELIYLDISRKVIPRDYVIYEKIDGKPLSSHFEDFNITKKQLEKLLPAMKQIGSYMSRIHKVKMEGYGYLRKTSGGFCGVSHSLQDAVMPRAELFKMANQGMLSKKFVDSIAHELTWGAVKFETSPVLLHQDLHSSNIMVDDDCNVTAFIDMENAMAGDPLMEFGRLNRFYFKNPEIMEAIQQGYENKEIFIGNYREKIRIYSIKFSSDLLPFYWKRRETNMVRQLENHIKQLLRRN